MESVMRASPQEYTHLLAYVRASRELTSWINGARALALLSGALESGVLDALRSSSTAENMAVATGIDPHQVLGLCQALEAHGVVLRDAENFQLAPDYALLASPDAAIPLEHVLHQAEVMLRELRTVLTSYAIYTGMDSKDILAMAEGAGISSLSAAPHVSQEATGQMLLEVEAVWRTGARHLEVGCGVGNALLGILETYPQVTAVGIEIDELTASEVERRATQLGLMPRVALRRMDACDLQDESSYDTIQWSQFFFPAATRPVVLAAMLRALKPGGYLIMPWMGSPADDPSIRRRQMLRNAWRAFRSGSSSFVSFLNDVLRDSPGRRKQERRFASQQRLLFSRWGIPMRSVEELITEVEDSGFRVLRSCYTPVNQFVLTRGLLLAQRDI